MTKPKTNLRRLKDAGGGVDPEAHERLKSTGALREFGSYAEAQAARAKRKETPVYLLPEDHYRKRKRQTITMDPKARAIAKKIGDGNISRGIEHALLHWFDCPRTDRRRQRKGEDE